ncbi:hypothetical protein TVAG_150380 [Trichomonas vaginalis G3]|uniref:Uncharacterized protein n=1 Tax=Trichomonas vaginalis (strain ATCC PRA-98 / G3) TaxID=412133 RepID=A2DRU0_TRIV3|nr:hypothetical protein TVAGG3_0978780 [Trichomonas vaginalis G3]EAY16887.1 hypothetical protein TVAG_150380 [Trichomonas vaginalis G3]KAI5489125.1 hypothetical protein TVAGG3_0978780 [Trichomonas vaginalis G3]|eukprot:XP_001329110.1 hypothetical protein [Trichomonas vaginalis G3]
MDSFKKANEQTLELSSAKKRLAELKKENSDLLDQIEDLEDQIVNQKSNNQFLMNDLTICSSSADSISVAPQLLDPSKDEVTELLQEHQILLMNRQKTTAVKEQTMDENYKKILPNLEQDYLNLLQEEAMYNKKLNNSYYKRHEWNILQKTTSKHVAFLNEQQKDRQRENVQMNQLLTKAKKAYDELLNRKDVILDDQRNQLAKTIRAKQNQITQLEGKIASVLKSIFLIKQNTDRAESQKRFNDLDEKRKADWSAEKQNLQSQLSEAKKRLADVRKEHMTRTKGNMEQIKELNDTLSKSDQDTYGYILRCYSGKEIDPSVVNDQSISKMWEQINQPRQELAILMKENAQKERKLAKMRKSLNVQIQQFRETELRNAKEAAESEEQFNKLEAKLLQKIKATKIMIAQNKFKSGKV